MSIDRNLKKVQEILKNKYVYLNDKNDIIDVDISSLWSWTPCRCHKVLTENLVKPEYYFNDDCWHWSRTKAEKEINIINDTSYITAFDENEDSIVSYNEARIIMGTIIALYKTLNWGNDCEEYKPDDNDCIKYLEYSGYLPFKTVIEENIQDNLDEPDYRKYIFILDATEEQINNWNLISGSGELTEFKPRDLIDFNLCYNQFDNKTTDLYEDLLKIKKKLDRELSHKEILRNELKEEFGF